MALWNLEEPLQKVIAQADRALYFAKKENKGSCCLWRDEADGRSEGENAFKSFAAPGLSGATRGNLSFLTEDVAFVGTGEGEYAQGKAEMARYLQNDILEISEPFSYTLSWIHEQAAGADTLFLSAELTLKNTVYAWRLRVAFVLVREERSWKIKSLYFSEPSSNQRDGEHYPWTLAMENTVRQRRNC